MKFVIEDMQTI